MLSSGPHRLTDTAAVVPDLSHTRFSTLNRTNRPNPGEAAFLWRLSVPRELSSYLLIFKIGKGFRPFELLVTNVGVFYLGGVKKKHKPVHVVEQ